MIWPLSLRLQGDLSSHQVKALKEYKPVDFVGVFFCTVLVTWNRINYDFKNWNKLRI